MEEYKCRTCLGVTEGQICTQITENCVDKSIKQSIIQLVPEMRSTLMDSEVVCNNCLKTLRSCMKFINRCLKIEIDIQENISKQLDALNNVEYNDNHLKMNISLDHDYFGETENASLDEDSNKDIKELKDFELGEDFKIEIVDDDIDSISSLKEYSQKSESNDTTQDDEENCLNEERDENFLDDDQDENYVDEDQDENFLDGDQEENYVDEDQDENSLDEDQDENFLDEDQDEEYVDGNQDEHFLDEDQDENYVDGDEDENYLQENFTFHECETCKETFTDKDSLKKHEKIHNLICKTCSQSFPTKKELITHQRSHAPFECDKCGKTFIAESHRIRHQSVHTRKEHICEICGKIFPTSSALRYHQISHRQERLFMCDKCPRRYKSRVNLKRHVQQYHEKVDQYQCPKCGILVGGRQTYSKHYSINLNLKNMERHKCRTCLDIVDRQRCIEISKKCYLDQTIKEVIIHLVPAMVPTLSDDDLICKNCLRTLKSTIKFIERCLEVEIIIAENEDQEEVFENDDLSDCAENVSEIDEETIFVVKPFEQSDQDHDYYVKYERVDSDDVTIENADEKYENSETKPIEIIFDSSVVNTEDTNTSTDNLQLPIRIIFDNSSTSYNESTSQNVSDGKNNQFETYDDTTSDIPLEDVKCEDGFKSENSVEHKGKFSCQTCSQEFSMKYAYDLHLEIHPPFTCEHCGKGIKTEYHYKRHLKVHEESIKICEICGKLFRNDSSLNCHINEEHNKIVYMCDQCPKIFKNKFRLNSHMKMVHEKSEQQHQCQCGKFFHRKESWENHYRLVHLQLKPFVCDVCGREFGRKDYLQKHMYYHTGEPRPVQHRNKIKSRNGRGKPPKFGIRLRDPGTPVNCKICGKLILSVHLLKSHLQSHVKIKRHKCSYCELTFTLSNNRDRHQRIHEADPEKKFRCNICWKKMTTEEELEKHLVGHYNRPPQHSCDICGEKFHRKYLLDNHHLDKHTDPGDIERAEKEIVIDNLLEYAHPNDIYELYDTKE